MDTEVVKQEGGEMGTMELEAMREDDFSWHPCTVSLNSTRDAVLVEFRSQDTGIFTLKKEQVLDHLRFRSLPLHRDDCSQIKEGDLVVATPTIGDGALYFDAKVVKVLRVRHNRGPCRCIFSITWLHKNLKDETKVPSGAIMKLSMKSINIYPVISALLEQQQAFPSLSANEAITGEMGFAKFTGRKTKGANNPSHHFQKQVSEETQLGSQAALKRRGSLDPVASTRVGSPNTQFPSEQKQLKRATRSSINAKVGVDPTRSSINAKVGVELDIDPAPTSSIMEEFSGNRLHRSPLAACAALASRVQISNCATSNGSTMFPVSVADGNFSLNISYDAIPIAAEPLRIEKPHISPPRSTLCRRKLVDISSEQGANKPTSKDETVPIAAEPLRMEIPHISPPRSTLCKRKLVEISSEQGTNKPNSKDETLECAHFSAENGCLVLGIPSSTGVLKGTKLPHHKEAIKVPIPASEHISTVTSCDNPRMHTCNAEQKVEVSSSNKRFTRSAVQLGKERIAADSEGKSCGTPSSETPEANISCHGSIRGASKKNTLMISCVRDMRPEASTRRQRFIATSEEKDFPDVAEMESSHGRESDNVHVDFSACESRVSKKKGRNLGKGAGCQLVEPSSGEEMENSKYADETLEGANFGTGKWKLVLGIPSSKRDLKETVKCAASTGCLAFQEIEKSESKDETLQCAGVGTESRNVVLGIPVQHVI